MRVSTDWESLVARPAGPSDALVVGVPPGLYARPLIEGLDREARVRLERGEPDILAERFVSGVFAAALLPPLDALRHPGGRIMPGLAVCASSEARCERLLCRVPPQDVRTVASKSRGAADRARLVLAEAYGALPDLVQGEDDADAVAVFGDEGLQDEGAWPYVEDLGRMWSAATELPWILAVWVTGPRASIAELRVILARAAQAGSEREGEMVREAPERHGVSVEIARECLESAWRYRLGGDEAESIRRLVRCAARHGLLDHENVRFS